MGKLKLAIFDMDGTLIDTEYTMWYHSKKTGFESLGYPYDDEFGDSMCGMNQANITKLILNRYPDFPIDEYWKIIKRENDLFLRTKEVPVIDGVFEILDYCKEKGIACCVATGSPRSMVELELTNTKLISYFDSIVTGDEIKNGKPAPDIYLKALAHYGFEKDEAIVFEDAPNGAHSAINAGIPLIYVPNVKIVPEEDKIEAFKTVNNLKEALEVVKKLVEN